ncbi:histidinol-phosphate transaminase [Inhella sp.]|uniref:histidinol-phosphate transaminase n=1 Tax=Inhella sp. TaxID=1921806 RepID=UPI0035B0EB0D
MSPLERVLSRVRPDVRALHPYTVQPSEGFIKLDVMENPHRLPPALQRELGERLGQVALNRYPAERTLLLKAALARHAVMPEGCDLVLGNGSDELISLLTQALARPGATVMAPLPSFVMYAYSANLLGVRFVGVDLRADFQLDLPAMLAAIERERPSLLWLACPNNPTATLWPQDDLDALVEAMAPHGLVVFDEAYAPFASRDARHRLARQPHVAVMRTLSKFGLAGVRIGYLLAPAPLAAELEKLRPPFNVSVLNTEAALFALEHEAVYEIQALSIRAERERLFQALKALPGATPFPSEANMVLARFPDAAATFQHLKARGILVKNVSAMHRLLTNCLRLTVGTPLENTQLIEALS